MSGDPNRATSRYHHQTTNAANTPAPAARVETDRLAANNGHNISGATRIKEDFVNSAMPAAMPARIADRTAREPVAFAATVLAQSAAIRLTAWSDSDASSFV